MPTPERASGIDRRRNRAATKKVTLSLDAAVLEAARARVDADPSQSLSGYASGALARQLADDAEEDAYGAFLRELDELFGAPSEADYAWAREIAAR